MRRFFKISKFILFTLAVLIAFVVIVLQFSYTQRKIAVFVKNNVLSEYGYSEIDFERIKIGLTGKVLLYNLRVPSKGTEDILRLEKLKVNVSVIALLRHKVKVTSLVLKGVKGNLYHYKNNEYNIAYLIPEREAITEKEEKEPKKISIEVNDVELEDIQFRFHDSISQVFLDVDLGYFKTNLRQSDILGLVFRLDKLRLEDTKVRLGLDERIYPRKPKEKVKDSRLPVIEVGKIKLKTVEFLLDDLAKESYLQAVVDRVNGQDAYVNITEERVEVKSLDLQNSQYVMDYTADTLKNELVESKDVENINDLSFSGGWTILAGKVSGKNNSAALHLSQIYDSIPVFHPSNFSVKNIDCDIRNTVVESKEIKTDILSVSAVEGNGFVLKEASVVCAMTENLGVFRIKKLSTSRSNFKADIDLFLPLGNANWAEFTPNILEFQGVLNSGDIMYFMPQLGVDEFFTPNDEILTDVLLQGTPDTIYLKKFNVEIASDYKLTGEGKLGNYKNFQKAYLSLKIDTIVFNTLEKIIRSDNLSFPHISAQASIEGSLDSLNGKYSISDNHNANIKGDLELNSDTIDMRFTSESRFFQVNVMDYTGDSLLVGIDGLVNVSGRLEDNELKQFSLTTDIDSLCLLDKAFYNVFVSGRKERDSLYMQANYSSKNVDIDMLASGFLHSDSVDVQYNVGVGHLNTQYFFPETHYGEFNFTAAGDVSVGTENCLKTNIRIPDLNISFNNEEYTFDPISATYASYSDIKSFGVNTKGVQWNMDSNLNWERSKVLIQNFISRNINLKSNKSFDSTSVFNAECLIESPTVIQNYVGAVIADTIEVDSFYLKVNLQERLFNAYINSPQMGYKGSKASDFKLVLDVQNASLNTRIRVSEFKRNKLHSNKFEFVGNNDAGNITSKLTLYDKSDRILTSIPIGITQVDSVLEFGFNNDTVVIGYNTWEYSQNIALSYDHKNGHWFSNGLTLRSGEERIEIVEEYNKIQAKVEYLDLCGLMSFFSDSQERILTGGLMSGFVSFDDHPEFGWTLSSELDLDNIELYGESYGNLKAKLNEIDSNKYEATLEIQNDSDYLNYSGSFGNDAEQVHKGDINISDLSLYSSLIDSNIVGLKGGAFKGIIEGSYIDKSFALKGLAKFKNTQVYLPDLGANYRINEDEITFTEKAIQFNETIIEDLVGNQLLLDGEISTQNYKEILFDLNVRSDYFQVLNTTEAQNDNFYGELVVRADIDLTGTNVAPKLKAKVRIHDQTNMTITLPGDDPLQTENQEIVRFTDNSTGREIDSLYIVNSLSSVSDSIEQVINKGNFDIQLTFSPKARYTIITNPISGDYAYFGLRGALVYRTSQTGLTEVVGNIQLVDGLYKISFYDMIKKEFIIEPQSSIYFSGPISNTSLDLRAKNIVRTNSLALMSSEAIGNSPEEKALYNQRLPYELYFNVEGLLLQPTISFALDLPEEHKRNSPMIASKLNKLATPEMEQERNMQVFALLVTGGFIAENTNVTSGSGSSNVAEATARNSVNSILSQQLNRLTSDNITYFDMNLGLNTYEDYARRGGQTTTDLDVQISKSMFDDRVSLEVESRINLDGSSTTQGQSSSNYNTDYKLYYNLNENGSIRIKAYNLSIYDLFDGDITNTGVGISFSKDFDGRKKDNYVELDSANVNE